MLELEETRLHAVLAPRAVESRASAGELVAQALAHPIASPRLAEMVRGRRRVTVVTSDHTRPLPSKETLPPLLAEIRRGNPEAEITILVGTGTHRPPTEGELLAKFGPEILGRERVICHRSDDPASLVTIGHLPSGVPIEINRLAVETDLLVAEGFIEPHFFAGFSGGPKSILPGIAGDRTIRANHSGANIAHPKARTGILAGNPVHLEMELAADLAGLAFISNVVLGPGGRVVAAFAGAWRAAHAAGVEFVMAHARVAAAPSAVTIATNGGYPLDQNLYQAVKGMTAAEANTLPGGRIIMVAGCADGIGGEGFAELLARMESPGDFVRWAESVPAEATPPDLWEAQILARILQRFPVTLVSTGIPPGIVLPPGLRVTTSLSEAVAEALDQAGPEARVTVIPDGVSVIPANVV